MGGRIVVMRRASIVFPEPGGPDIIKLCAPAAAISIALFATNCPCTSEKSTSAQSVSFVRDGIAGANDWRPFKNSTTSASVFTAYTCAFSTRSASSADSGATKYVSYPASCPASTMDRMPGTGRISPLSDSSPMKSAFCTVSAGT